MITRKLVTYHVHNRQCGCAHDFASLRKAIDFGRALSRFYGPGLATFVIAQERDELGQPTAAPEIIWARRVSS